MKIDIAKGTEDVFVNSDLLENPSGIAADGQGNLYVADQKTGEIYKIPVDSSGIAGDLEKLDISTTGVEIVEPHGLALVTNSDGTISLYITDEGENKNNIIRIDIESASDSNVTAAIELTPPSSGGSATDTTVDNAQFDKPHGITVNGNGAIFVADENNNRIQIITPGGNVVIFVGTGIAGDRDGDADEAQFNGPRGMAMDRNGNVLVCDYGNGKIKMILN